MYQRNNTPASGIGCVLGFVACVIALLIFWPKQPALTSQVEMPFLLTAADFPVASLSHLDVGSLKNVASLQQGGQGYLGLRLGPGLGNHAGLTITYPSGAGESMRYTWHFMLPAALAAADGQMVTLAQWHEQITTILRTPSPTVAITLVGGQARLVYGTNGARSAGSFAISPGAWHTLTAVIAWSEKDDGSAAIYLDDPDHMAASASGPNLRANQPQSLDLGLYTDADLASENWVYVYGVKVAFEGGK